MLWHGEEITKVINDNMYYFHPLSIFWKKYERKPSNFFLQRCDSNLLDAYVVGTNKVEYPVRPFPKIFKTNIVYDMLFFPLLSVIWVKLSYHDKLPKILLKSLIFSVPMSLGQWFFEKNTSLFKWKRWSPFHTFVSVNFTLFLIRGLVGLIKKLDVR